MTTRERFTHMLDALWETQWVRGEAERAGSGIQTGRDEVWQRRVHEVDEVALEAVLEFVGPVLGSIVSQCTLSCPLAPEP